MTLLTTAEEISDIAFGFMGSKALFAALHFGVFTHLAEGPMTAEELGKAAGLPAERARTLLTAVASLGLVSVDDERWRTACRRTRRAATPSGSTTRSRRGSIRKASTPARSARHAASPRSST